MVEITLSLSQALLNCHLGISGIIPLLKPTNCPEETWKLAMETVLTFHGNRIFTNVQEHVPQISERFSHGAFLRPVLSAIFEGGVNLGRVMVMIDFCAGYSAHLISIGKHQDCEIVENELFLALLTHVTPWLNGRQWKIALIDPKKHGSVYTTTNASWSWWNVLYRHFTDI